MDNDPRNWSETKMLMVQFMQLNTLLMNQCHLAEMLRMAGGQDEYLDDKAKKIIENVEKITQQFTLTSILHTPPSLQS